ncbi:MAG: MFS transporter, partial [Alphaproteobacteria bacterium]
MSEHTARGLMRRNVALLALCQALANISTGVMLAMAALVGYMLATDKSMSTLPHAIQWEAVAAFAVPTALMMRRLGRRRAFTVGALLGCTAALVGAFSIYSHEFWIYVAATTLFGCFNATAQQIRFAAAEVADEAFRSIAISLVIGAAVVAAFIGPEIAKRTWQAIPGYDFAGTFLVLAAIPLLIIVAVRFVTFPPPREVSAETPPRPMAEIARQPGFIVAVLSATIGWGV